ncbi:glycosyltransferase family 2 protein [Oerskovia sp. KBS0722]|nr:glycosyltransferase family 2 protein [Oerskovia sp. KBS0722]
MQEERPVLRVPLDIMMPFWGDPGLLRQTVQSVLDQTNGDWVLTVVDDAYPDPAVAEYFASIDDPRISYHRHDVNVGITANYEWCVAHATHDVVVILGCDDIMLPNYVDVILDAHARFPHVDIIQPGVQVIDGTGAVSRTLVDEVKQRVTMPRGSGARVVSGEALAASLLRADWLYWPSLAFRRERLVATPFRAGFPLIQDLALVIDMVSDGAELLIEPTLCFSYRRHDQSASSLKLLDGTRFAGEREYFRLAARQVEQRGWRRAARAARNHLTSRAHALTLVPRAVRVRGLSGAKPLLAHTFKPLSK